MNPSILDGAAAVILILFVVSGYRKGISKIFSKVLCYVISAVLSLLVSNMMADYLYEVYVQDSVVLNLSNTIESFNIRNEIQNCYKELSLGNDISDKDIEVIMSSDKDDIDIKMTQIIKDRTGVSCDKEEVYKRMSEIVNVSFQNKIGKVIPSCAGKYFNDSASKNKTEIFDVMRSLYSYPDSHTAAKFIEQTYIRNLMIKFMKIVIFSVCFVALMVIIQIIIKIMPKSDAIVNLNTTNRVIGGGAGLFIGIVFLLFAATFLKLLIYSGVSGENLNDEVINQTKFFTYFYNFDYLLLK
ncbi:MAG: hypothetical protein Q4F95_10550 [Oscillospiraceae bacterium]|nr:hypothetical protein [Oscillospiraceae bacterium]